MRRTVIIVVIALVGVAGLTAVAAQEDALELVGYDASGNEVSREPIEVGDAIEFPSERVD